MLCEVVGWHSRTGTQGEIEFPNRIKKKILELDYFQENESHIQFQDAGKGRNAVTALYKSPETKKTIVLISHFDTVHTEDFGDLEYLAFDPIAITETFKKEITRLPKEAQEDLKSGEYLFGRGVMDMKMGLVAHLHLLEKASVENWPINLLLVTVPDEEINSSGMRAAVDGLVDLREEHDLEYVLFLNSEPSFARKPNDKNYYIYSGTIGKIMPSALFYGVETHVGEPLRGITGHYMASYLTREMEFNKDFVEEVYGEETPLPVVLQVKDLKEDYSVQTSHHVFALYNVLLMKRNAEDIMKIFRKTAETAMAECMKDYKQICENAGVEPVGNIKVLEYQELLEYAQEKLGPDKVAEIKNEVMKKENLDDREMSVLICDSLMNYCRELAPATILFFTPPYYPAINSSENELVKEKIKLTQDILKEKFNQEAIQIHYFNGICDLSYVNYDQHDTGWKSYQNNTPVWGDVYTIPFEGMQKLQAPVMNIGHFGLDSHKISERLHKKSGFVYTPYVLEEVIKSFF